VGEGVGQFVGPHVADEMVDIVADTLQVEVLRLGDVPDQDMHHAAVLGKTRGDFLGEEEVRPIAQAQAARDGIVVGEGHQSHPARFAQLVLTDGIGVALGAAENLRVPLVVHDGSGRMHVQVATADRVGKNHWGRRYAFRRRRDSAFVPESAIFQAIQRTWAGLLDASSGVHSGRRLSRCSADRPRLNVK